jgi:hypothetical protein
MPKHRSAQRCVRLPYFMRGSIFSAATDRPRKAKILCPRRLEAWLSARTRSGRVIRAAGAGSREASALPTVDCLQNFVNVACTGLRPDVPCLAWDCLGRLDASSCGASVMAHVGLMYGLRRRVDWGVGISKPDKGCQGVWCTGVRLVNVCQGEVTS